MQIRGMLPQQSGRLMTNAGGFELLNDARGISCLRDYHRKVVEAAVANGFGVINEGLHYCASRDWDSLVGFTRQVGATRTDQLKGNA